MYLLRVGDILLVQIWYKHEMSSDVEQGWLLSINHSSINNKSSSLLLALTYRRSNGGNKE